VKFIRKAAALFFPSQTIKQINAFQFFFYQIVVGKQHGIGRGGELMGQV
jgi:hypothetical protein